MRWTRQYRTTNDAGCGRRSRVVLMPRRWHQVRQASDERQWQKSPVAGESTKETVKTIARKRRFSRWACGAYLAVLFIFAREAAGASSTRRFPRPLSSWAKRKTQLGRNLRR